MEVGYFPEDEAYTSLIFLVENAQHLMTINDESSME